MPQAVLSSQSVCDFDFGDNFNQYYLGWAYPPKDYAEVGEIGSSSGVLHEVAKSMAAPVELVLGSVE